MKSNPSITCSDELYQSLTNIIAEANLPKVYQKTNGTKEKGIPTASKQEQEKIENAPSADITTSEAAAAAAATTPVTDVPVDSEPKATEEPIIKVEETTTAADVTKENEATNATGPDATNTTATTTTTV